AHDLDVQLLLLQVKQLEIRHHQLAPWRRLQLAGQDNYQNHLEVQARNGLLRQGNLGLEIKRQHTAAVLELGHDITLGILDVI
ncbi:hypothetical protein RA282_29630, partial [Pseudomonas syringae pv. tagetis]